jgi:uncharacterized C2H2 Zn-finger protein
VNTLWTCPKCGRQFKNKNQWHSCVTISVDDHFKGKPNRLRATFDRLFKELKRFGNVRIDAVKSGINLARDSHFAMAFIKNEWINLDFDVKRELHSPRFEKVFRVYNDNFSYRVRLREPSDVDEEVLGWLKEAYENH